MALRAVSVSNDLYGNYSVSAYEMAKGFTRPMEGNVVMLQQDITDAHLNMQARRKLSLILKSKATKEIPLCKGDVVKVFTRPKVGKRGQWSLPKKVMILDHDDRNIIVPGKAGYKICVVFEDI